MSVSIQTVEFERREAYLSELEEGPPWTVHGVALGSGDVTLGQSGVKKVWPGEELQKAAETLEGRSLVVDHDNNSSGVVGEVTKAGFKEGTGVIYEAELFDEDLAEKINNGLLEVSIRGHHIDVDQMEETEDGAKVVEGIKFDNLSIVPTGAAPSNTIEMGGTEELSVAELAAFTDELQEDFEAEAGDYVQWGDKRGIVLTMPEDGEVEVDLYEDDDGTWRAIGETENVSVGDLSEWEVDEEDIGSAAEDEEESEEEESEDEEEASEHKMDPEEDDDEEEEMKPPEDFIFDSREEAEDFIEGKDGLTGVHEMDEGWMPGADHDEFAEWHEAVHGEEMTEGSERRYQTKEQRDDGRETQPERFIDADPDSEMPGGDDEELEGSIHEPAFDGRDSNEWNKPSLDDFTDESWEDLSDSEKEDIGGHFLFSMTGFPADNFSDMKLPIVRPNGTLSMSAVDNADARLGQTDGLSDDQRDRVQSILDDLQGDDEEEAREARPRTIDDAGNEPGVAQSSPAEIALDLINKYLRIEGHHERDKVDGMLSWLFGATDLPPETMADFRVAAKRFLDETPGTDAFSGLTIEQFRDWLLMHGEGSQGRREQEDETQRGELPPGKPTPVHVLTGDDFRRRNKSEESELDNAKLKVTNMTEDIEEKLAELSEPVAVEQSDLEELQEKADRFGEMSETLESLKERTDILDEADREQVEELAEAEDPVVVESARYEELTAEAEEVKGVYAAALAEEMPAFSAEELAENFGIESLREKYEEHIGDLEEELASEPEPRSGDVEEEELEERAEEETEAEELEPSETEEAEAKREELREKILGR